MLVCSNDKVIPTFQASKENYKYGVKYVEVSFFKDNKLVCEIRSVKATKVAGAPYVVNIRQFRYKPDGKIDINLTYSNENWGALPHNIILRYIDASQLYTTPLKISFAKYNHLQEIKTTIPKECHHFYDNIDQHGKRQHEMNSLLCKTLQLTVNLCFIRVHNVFNILPYSSIKRTIE